MSDNTIDLIPDHFGETTEKSNDFQEEMEREIENMQEVALTQNTEIDPDLNLKQLIKEQYPKLDGLMISTAIENHKRWVAAYGEDYNVDEAISKDLEIVRQKAKENENEKKYNPIIRIEPNDNSTETSVTTSSDNQQPETSSG